MPDAPTWCGTVTMLLIELHRHELLVPLIRRMRIHSMARDLQNLIRQGCPWVSYQHTTTAHLTTIHRPTPEEVSAGPGESAGGEEGADGVRG